MISCYFGLPGVGKSTFLAKIAQKELKRIKKGKSVYKRVFTNFPVKGCYELNFKNLGIFDYSYSLVLIDEITLDADNRQFKSFPVHVRDLFILHRKHHMDIIYFTQNWNAVDKKIRDLTATLYYLKRLSHFTVGVRVFRNFDINKYSSEMVFGYRFPNTWERIKSYIVPGFSICCFCFRPLYYKYFDSWDAPALPSTTYKEWNFNNASS